MNTPIKVALEATALLDPQRTGIQVYSENVIRELSLRPGEISFRVFHKARPFRKAPSRIDQLSESRPYIHSRFANVGDCRITHSTDSKFLYKKGLRNIVTAHDAAIFLPEHDIDGFTTPSFRARRYEISCRMYAKADRIISVSESTKSDIIRLFSVDPNKVMVIYQGVDAMVESDSQPDEEKALDAFGLQPDGYLLFVGAISIRKNLLSLLEAYGRSKVKHDLGLVLAGPMSMGSDRIVERVNTLGLSARVSFTSAVSDAELSTLYKNAKALLFPTYYEGFGRPILEAMSFGMPVLVGNRGSAPEVSGGLAVEADPFSVDEITRGIQSVIEREPNSPALVAHARSFTWDRFGRQLVGLYRELSD